jgi:VanZ family protein
MADLHTNSEPLMNEQRPRVIDDVARGARSATADGSADSRLPPDPEVAATVQNALADRVDIQHPRHRATLAAILWTALVIYGSLLPFDYSPQSVSLAWERFLHARMYEIGPAGRADWLANLLLYAPLAFLWLGALDNFGSRFRRVVVGGVVVLVLCGLAVAIEFLQMFVPRTVSLNDIIAEMIGTLIGAVAWLLAGRRTAALFAAFAAGGKVAARALGMTYVLAYVALALFPFDFFLSPAEFAQKDLAGHAAWWLAPQACVLVLQCPTQLVAEALFAIPIGIALVIVRSRPIALVPLLAVSLLFGVGIEVAQLFLLSGVSQGASVLAKAVGVLGGGLLAPHLGSLWSQLRASRALPPTLILLWIAHVAAVAVLLGFWRGIAVSWPEAVARLADVRWVPFYNYYYTSETRALASVLVQAALYVPPGVLIALGARSLGDVRGATIAGIASGLLALAAQVSRLVHPPQRPDPTDVLIAIVAGFVGYRLAKYLVRLLESPAVTPAGAALQQDSVVSPHNPAGSMELAALDGRSNSLYKGAFALIVLTVLAGLVLDYPLSRVVLGLGLLAYVFAIGVWPWAWLVLLPAALPVMDFAAWSGRMFWSEFDYAVLATSLVACWRNLPSRAPAPTQSHFTIALVIVLGTSIFVSLARGLVPFDTLDANAFATSYSHYNALRIVKGVAWAALLCWLAAREPLPGSERSRLVAFGLVLGVAGVIAVVLWERFLFSGLFNFAHEYRVTGPFWEMNTGGAAIEGYLVSALPFVLYSMLVYRNVVVRALAGVVFAGAIYAALVTLSRAGIVAIAIELAVICVGLFRHLFRVRRAFHKGLIGTAMMIALAGIVAIPALMGPTLKARFANVDGDLHTRLEHWSSTLNLREPAWDTQLFGMGFGRFPEAFLFGTSSPSRPTTYKIVDEGGKRFLRLGSGEPLWFEQFVSIRPYTHYTLSLSLRAHASHATFVVPICEKWLLESFECVSASFELASFSADFQHHAIEIYSGAVSKGAWYTRRPAKLALHIADSKDPIDIADVRLTGPDGANLVANGDFSRGMDRWQFSTDNHLPWHIKNLFLQTLFDQGWIGVLAWSAVVLVALVRAASASWRGDLFATSVLAGLVGFLVVGLFDSLIDGPRLMLVFCVLLWLAAKPGESVPVEPDSATCS